MAPRLETAQGHIRDLSGSSRRRFGAGFEQERGEESRYSDDRLLVVTLARPGDAEVIYQIVGGAKTYPEA